MASSRMSRPTGTESQTEPILVPFPLPPIGKIHSDKKEVAAVLIQTDYVWLGNEFPTRNSEAACCTREGSAMETPVPRVKSPRKKSTEKKLPDAQVGIDIVSKQLGATGELADEVSVPVTPSVESPESTEDARLANEVQVASTPKKGVSKRSKISKVTEEQPATPATSAGPETPMAASETTSLRKESVKPVLSDSSDDEHPLLHTPTSRKPTVLTSVKPSVPSKKETSTKKSIPQPPSASESEAEAHSSSSESDADVPSVSLISSKKRKDDSRSKETVQTPASVAKPLESPPPASRLGPLVQVNDVAEGHIEILHQKINELIPEPLRAGAIKEAVFDEPNSRIVFQLRITPKVVNFMSANGGLVKLDDEKERKLVVLSDSLKKKAASLFNEETPVKKRRQI